MPVETGNVNQVVGTLIDLLLFTGTDLAKPLLLTTIVPHYHNERTNVNTITLAIDSPAVVSYSLARLARHSA